MMKREDIEIMSPVGSYESLQAAVQAGADAVYFGVEKLNMRAQSSFNFTLDDLKEIVRRTREAGIKTYLTVNTVLYDEEMDDMRKVVHAARENGVSAIIASDMSVINYARSLEMEVHISTQLNVSNFESLKFYSQFADTIVLARELNLEQVYHISKRIEEERIKGPSGKSVKIEMFIHGALCMAISGKCYLSLHENNYSANRGRCLQTCRKAYIVKEKERGNELEVDNEYIMSPKDLATIHFLNKILDSGVKVLKIEGRARSPEYVKTVTQCYREAVDAYLEGTYEEDKIEVWKNRLTSVFNRGFWDGYYLGQRLGEWSHKYGSQATTRKIFVGDVTNYFKKIGVAEILPRANTLSAGDEILIIGPTTGVIESRIEELRVEDQNVQAAAKGVRASFPIKELVRRSDKLYKVIRTGEA